MTNVRVPFICKLKPGRGTKEGYQQVDEKELQEYYDDYYNEDPYPDYKEEEEDEMYGLKVHQLLLGDSGEKQGATLLKTRSDSNRVFRDIKRLSSMFPHMNILFSPARWLWGTKSM